MVSVVQTAVRRDRRQQARHERRDVSTLRHTGGHRVARGTYLFKQPALMTGAFAHDDALTVHNMVGQPLPDVAESPRVDAPHGPLLLDDADDMPQDRILCPTVVHEIEVANQDELAARTAERDVQQARSRVDV